MSEGGLTLLSDGTMKQPVLGRKIKCLKNCAQCAGGLGNLHTIGIINKIENLLGPLKMCCCGCGTELLLNCSALVL